MPKTEREKNGGLLGLEGNSIFVWLLQSSVIVALVAAILYAFGANFDYRLRWEFGMQNIHFARQTSDLTYDGLIVVSAWFRTFQPYALAVIGSLTIIFFRTTPAARLSSGSRRIIMIVLGIAFVAASGLLINGFLRTRATRIANVIRERAAASTHSLLLADDTALDGYIVSSSEERTAILTRSGVLRIVAAKDIKALTLPPGPPSE
jgi:hypothetical protein